MSGGLIKTRHQRVERFSISTSPEKVGLIRFETWNDSVVFSTLKLSYLLLPTININNSSFLFWFRYFVVKLASEIVIIVSPEKALPNWDGVCFTSLFY